MPSSFAALLTADCSCRLTCIEMKSSHRLNVRWTSALSQSGSNAGLFGRRVMGTCSDSGDGAAKGVYLLLNTAGRGTSARPCICVLGAVGCEPIRDRPLRRTIATRLMHRASYDGRRYKDITFCTCCACGRAVSVVPHGFVNQSPLVFAISVLFEVTEAGCFP